MADEKVTRGGDMDVQPHTPPDDDVAEASEESFPASDPPARTVVTGPHDGALSAERRKRSAAVKKDLPGDPNPS